MGMYFEVRAVESAELDLLLARRKKPAEVIPNRRSPGAVVSLEKAWHGLHFLLTGSAWEVAWPLGFLLGGGQPVGDDLGYGPARFLRPEAVQELHAALAAVSDTQLWSRFDPAQMEAEEIYPGVWDEPEADLREEYVGYFHELKQLIQQASTNGQALLLMLG